MPDAIRQPSKQRALGALPVLVLSALLATCGAPAEEQTTVREPGIDLPGQADAAAAVIDEQVLREPIARLASDEFQGRGPGSEGDRLARAYLVEQLRALGLEPGAPGDQWEQRFSMVGVTSEAPATWTFRGEGGRTLDLARREEFVAFTGMQQPEVAVEDAEVVFVGYGIQAPEHEWDDFAGADVAGKVLLVLNNDPDWDSNLFAGVRRLYYGRWDYKYAKAAEMGAAGAIIIHTEPSAGYGFNVVQSSWSGEQFELAPEEGVPTMPLKAWVTEDSARRLAALGGQDLAELVEAAKSADFTPVPLGVTTSIALANQMREVETANVVGRLPGRDPELADEAVVYTAHFDHLGVGDPDDAGDTIFNGARDNAAGASMILATARAFRALPAAPRRSVLFLFTAAEEQGLLGARHFVADPPLPPGKMAAVINLDSPNIWGETDDVTFIGYEKSTLGEVVSRLAAEQGRVVQPDQYPDKGYFYRSDQLPFAQAGVPAAYLDPGTAFRGRPAEWGREQNDLYDAQHYHQQSDELTDDWDFSGMILDARLAFATGLAVAEAEEMPSWKPGDEFEEARRAAIAAAEGTTEPPPAD